MSSTASPEDSASHKSDATRTSAQGTNPHAPRRRSTRQHRQSVLYTSPLWGPWKGNKYPQLRGVHRVANERIAIRNQPTVPRVIKAAKAAPRTASRMAHNVTTKPATPACNAVAQIVRVPGVRLVDLPALFGATPHAPQPAPVPAPRRRKVCSVSYCPVCRTRMTVGTPSPACVAAVGRASFCGHAAACSRCCSCRPWPGRIVARCIERVVGA